MFGKWGVALAGAGLLVSSAFAQPQQPQQPSTATQGQEKVQLPRGQMPDLGRPTRKDDQPPLFNFDEYFIGKWTFEWDVPEGPLGPAGHITGTTVYKPLDTHFYQATTEATGPAGPIKMTEIIAYQKENKALSRYVTDSRGFSFMQAAPIGGDLGGYFNIYYEGTPFTVNGKTVRLKHSYRLLSPVNYKVSVTMSVDGGPFKNYGNPWWRKEVPGVTSK